MSKSFVKKMLRIQRQKERKERERQIKNGKDVSMDVSDVVITEEGKIDVQSLYGKAISGVADAAHAQNIPVVCFVGCVGDDVEKLKALGIAEIYALNDIAPSPEFSMTHAAELLRRIAAQFLFDFFK